jgi:hypothetical protein
MIDDLDEVLRQLLIRELPVKNSEVEIAFDQPKREWSSRLSRPTLNLFVYDLHENNRLRASKQWQVEYNGEGTAIQRRQPIRLDVHYMTTAWAADPGDEHRLLARALLVFLRLPSLPDDLLPQSLKNQPRPIPIEVAQPDALRNAPDIWSVLDNEMRPAIAFTVTLSLDPYVPVTEPLVRTRELRIGQAVVPSLPSPWAAMERRATEEEPSELGLPQLLDERAGRDEFWTIGGNLHSDRPLEDLHLTLVERGLYVPILPGGRFTIGNLQAGHYTLEVSVEGEEPLRHKIAVPAPDYDLEV